VRATVANSEWTAFGIAPEHQWNAQQHRGLECAAVDAFSPQSGIPEAAQEAVVRTDRIGHEWMEIL
jgi:hypothetical protein